MRVWIARTCPEGSVTLPLPRRDAGMVDVREQEGNELVAVPHDGQTSTEMGFTGMTSASISGAVRPLSPDTPVPVRDSRAPAGNVQLYEALLLPLLRDEKIMIIYWKTTKLI